MDYQKAVNVVDNGEQPTSASSDGAVDIFAMAMQQQSERKKAEEEREQQRWASEEGTEEEEMMMMMTGVEGDGGNRPPTSSGLLIFCGAPNSGKSTLIARCLLETSPAGRMAGLQTERSVALEYTFTTRPQNGGGRQVVHCWELAGGGFMANLLEIPMGQGNIHTISVLLFLDLTRPEQFQSLVEPLLGICRKRVGQLAGQKQAKVPSADKRVLRPLGIPLVLICSRYDEFQNLDSERKRITYRSIRLFAHINGASIITFSNRMDSLIQRARSLLAHFAFGTPLSRAFCVDPQQPLLVFPHGMDSLEKIDPSPDSSLRTMGSFSEAMFHFIHSLSESFPQQSIQSDEMADEEAPSADKQFAEPAIDSLVEDGLRKLELYAGERRNRLKAEQKDSRNDAPAPIIL